MQAAFSNTKNFDRKDEAEVFHRTRCVPPVKLSILRVYGICKAQSSILREQGLHVTDLGILLVLCSVVPFERSKVTRSDSGGYGVKVRCQTSSIVSVEACCKVRFLPIKIGCRLVTLGCTNFCYQLLIVIHTFNFGAPSLLGHNARVGQTTSTMAYTFGVSPAA